MAMFFVLLLCLTITGQINAEENAEAGKAVVVAKVADGGLLEKINSVKSGGDGAPKTGEYQKLSDSGEESGEEMTELQLDVKANEAEKAKKPITGKSMKEDEDSDKNVAEMKGDKGEQNTSESGNFKQLLINKPGPPGVNNQRFGAGKPNPNKFVPPNKNQMAMPPRNKPNIHPHMMKGQPKAANGNKNNNKNRDLPNGGKVVIARLPDSLLMKQVPKLNANNNGQPKMGGFQPKRKMQPLIRKPVRNLGRKPVNNIARKPVRKPIRNRRKPVRGPVKIPAKNNRNQMNGWRVVRG